MDIRDVEAAKRAIIADRLRALTENAKQLRRLDRRATAYQQRVAQSRANMRRDRAS